MEIYNNGWLLQEDVTSANNGKALYPNHNDQITVFITGTSTSREVFFEGMDSEDNWYGAAAFKQPTYTMASSTTGTNEAWVLDTSPWVAVRTRVGSVAGGTVRITAKVVNLNA